MSFLSVFGLFQNSTFELAAPYSSPLNEADEYLFSLCKMNAKRLEQLNYLVPAEQFWDPNLAPDNGKQFNYNI